MARLDSQGKPIPIPKPGKKRQKRKIKAISNTPEAQLQAKVEKYLELHQIRYLHIPDRVYRMCAFASKTPIHVKQELSYYLKGVPDLLIFQDDRCLILELKTEKGKVRQPQKAWLKGIKHYVPRSFIEAMKIINDWRTR